MFKLCLQGGYKKRKRGGEEGRRGERRVIRRQSRVGRERWRGERRVGSEKRERRENIAPSLRIKMRNRTVLFQISAIFDGLFRSSLVFVFPPPPPTLIPVTLFPLLLLLLCLRLLLRALLLLIDLRLIFPRLYLLRLLLLLSLPLLLCFFF